MSSIPGYPKIYNLGNDAISNLFQGEVELSEKLDGCFTYDTAIMLADGTKKEIGKIVNQKLKLQVLSYNEKTHQIEKKRIINWFKNGTSESWLKIYIQHTHGQSINLKCTPNHPILTSLGWKKAKDLKLSDEIIAYDKQPNYFQEQLLYGSLLGDASISNGKYSVSHCKAQKELLDLKKQILNDFEMYEDNAISGYGSKIYRISLHVSDITKTIYKNCFLNNKRNINKKWLKLINELGLAFWYMDDGSFGKSQFQKGKAHFHTNRYSLEDNQKLCNFLRSKFGFNVSIYKNRTYYYLSLDTISTYKMFAMIAQYIPQSLRYKISSEFHYIPILWDNIKFPPKTNVFIKKRILKINSFIPFNKTKYDLEIENNHNYLVNNIIVHNSQFSFGITKNCDIVMRSKGQEMFFEPYSHQKMFELAVKQVGRLINTLRNLYTYHSEIKENGIFFYCEFLSTNKHNVLCYEKPPKNNLMLFGVKISENFVSDYEKLKWYAERLEIDVCPLLFKGNFGDDKQVNYEKLKSIVTQTISYLGGSLIEGVVIKNYNQDVTKGYPQGICIGKFVREEFKEKLHKQWKTISGKSKLEDFIEGFRTEARWVKAIGHLREKGELENAPKDIGKLLKEIQIDMINEEKEFIKDSLYKLFIDNIKRKSIAGFPEFYKDYLMKKQFETKESRGENR